MRRVSLLFALALASSTLVAQTYKPLFPAVDIAWSPVAYPYSDSIVPTVALPWAGVTGGSGTLTTFEDAVPFNSTQVYLSCGSTDTAYLTGSNDATNTASTLIVDNYVQVQTDSADGSSTQQNYCPNVGTGGCFSGQTVYPNAVIGGKAKDYYSPVPDQQMNVAVGDALYTIRLMDWGFTKASSAVYLKTTCKVRDQVCHVDNATKKDKTITIDPAGVAAHLRQGDTLGKCADGH